ncbi:MAG: hypothetical protein ACHBN1_12605 [Heteroscytonema crispum UTEX LB 1556]
MGREGEGEMGRWVWATGANYQLPTTNYQPPTNHQPTTNPCGLHQSPGSGNPTKGAGEPPTTNQLPTTNYQLLMNSLKVKYR